MKEINTRVERAAVLRRSLAPLALLAALTLGMFGDALFASQEIVLGNGGEAADMGKQFIHWRAFGFGELRHGNLPLWNPHIFSGAPFFGGFQSALLYPLNAVFLFLPLAKAIAWSIALHVFLAGAFTFAWAARRGLRTPACFLAAGIFMFCGANFLHIYAGHLPNVCAFAWAPLLFLAIDGMFDTPSMGWSLLGMFAVAMQILAGHPQYVFYTGVAAGIYCALCWFKANARGRVALGLAAIVLGAAALTAVQLLTSFHESGEMLRSGGVPYDFAAAFSFPPENFLTMFAPNFFGDMKHTPYWGRCFLWEMSLFIGVSGLALATIGAIFGERSTRRFSVVIVALMLLLALGSHTPLFKLLYRWAPGFDKFRGNSKFIFLASLFLAMLAGIGFDKLLKGARPGKVFIGAVVIAGLLLLGSAAWTHHSSSVAAMENPWHSLMRAIPATGENWLVPEIYDDAVFVRQAGTVASRNLLIGGVLLLVTALLLAASRKYRPAVWLLMGLALIELLVYARNSLDSFPLDQFAYPQIRETLKAHPGDYRILNGAGVNAAMSLGARDIWGHDPGVLRRYAQVMALTQNVDPNEVTQDMSFSDDHPLFGMFGCRFIFATQDNRIASYERTNYLPRALLVQRCRVLKSPDEIFLALTNAGFNPREEVILENTPEPQPQPSADSGSVELATFSTDTLTIEADVKSPAILLVTDTYAKGWRVVALPGSAQSVYKILPANFCLRAIPLAAGHHHFRMEYAPFGFKSGKWISTVSLLLFCGLALSLWWRNYLRGQIKHSPTAKTPSAERKSPSRKPGVE